MLDYPRNIVGPQLRRLRNEQGLSQAALAAQCQRIGWDVSRDIVNRMESGERWVSDMELVILSAVFGVEIQALLPSKSVALKTSLARLRTTI